MKFFLLSYPRSGNTWSRYLIEYFSQKPTTSCPTSPYPNTWAISSKDNRGLCESVNLPEVNKKAQHISVKKHKMFPSEKDTMPLILIVRNYKEVLIRHLGDKRSAIKHLNGEDKNIVNYFDCLESYDNWNGKKLLLYYEDLISKPEESIEKLTKFINCYNQKRIEEFIKKLDYHRKNAIKSYETITVLGKEASKTKGKQEIFHSKNMSVEEKREWDNIVKKRFPDLFNKYLQRYSE